MIELRAVRKIYASEGGEVRALDGVDLKVARGELIALVGASGSGKSTLMNLVGCLDRPTSGEVRLLGLDVGELSPEKRAIVRNRLIGFVFQGFNLLARETALANCEVPLEYRGVPRKERRALAERALASVGLAHRVNHTPTQLSGGQQQRVAIARAIVTEPPLLLADEPTGNLDTETSYEVLALLQRLAKERGITVVIVTHEPDIAACAERVITVKDGHIVSDERNEKPVIAAALLAKKDSTIAATTGPAKARNVTLNAVRRSVAFGSVLGAIAGALYNNLIGGGGAFLVPLGAGIGAALLVARSLRRSASSRPAIALALLDASALVVLALGAAIALFGFRALGIPHHLARRVASPLGATGIARASVVAYSVLQFFFVTLLRLPRSRDDAGGSS